MAVVGISDIKGDSKELLAKYDRAQPLMRERGPAPGLLAHTCVVLPDGMRIANVWESEEQLWAGFDNPQFREMLRSVGLEPVRPTVYPIHNQVIFSAAAAR